MSGMPARISLAASKRFAWRGARSQTKKIRILIADREGVFRIGLKKLFSLEDDLRVVAQAENRAQLVSLAKRFKPDLLFVQTGIADEGGGDALAALQDELQAARGKIVITASAVSEDEELRYVKRGASGVILRSVDPALFVKSARKIMSNELWLPKRQVAHMAKQLEAAATRAVRPVDTLTRREKSVISCLMQGWRNKEIAQHLSITEQTVKNHLRTIYDKVGVSDRLELVLYAIHQRLELPPAGAAAANP